MAAFLICGSVKCIDVRFDSGLVFVGELDFVASLEQKYIEVHKLRMVICEEWNCCCCFGNHHR